MANRGIRFATQATRNEDNWSAAEDHDAYKTLNGKNFPPPNVYFPPSDLYTNPSHSALLRATVQARICVSNVIGPQDGPFWMTGRSKSYPNDHLLDSWADTSTCGRHPPKQRSKCSCYLIFSIIVWRVQGSMPKFEKLWRIRFQSTNNSVVNFRLKNRFQKCEQETIQVLFPILMHLCTLQNLAIYRKSVSTFAALSVTLGAAPREV